ncbi:hypothetical protein [Desulfosporosinus fructosivorans]|nr:hypothetical protein [Desulfosporosinus fructosivorans]
MKKWFEGWNSKYQRKDIGDGYTQALVLKGCKFLCSLTSKADCVEVAEPG